MWDLGRGNICISGMDRESDAFHECHFIINTVNTAHRIRRRVESVVRAHTRCTRKADRPGYYYYLYTTIRKAPNKGNKAEQTDRSTARASVSQAESIPSTFYEATVAIDPTLPSPNRTLLSSAFS